MLKQKNIILNNLQILQDRIHTACLKNMRDPSSVQLLLATKTQDIETINIALDAGFGLIGENKIQELSSKIPLLSKHKTLIMPRENHFIGHLQSNKLKDAVRFADCIQSIDQLNLALKLNNYCLSINKIQDIYIQVNTSQELSKYGLDPDYFLEFLSQIQSCLNLNIKGLMTLGLQSEDEALVRQGFTKLRELSISARKLGLIPQDALTLSMGMSNDLEWAIAEGATLIRVGAAVFGARV